MSIRKIKRSKINNPFDLWIVQDFFDKIEIYTDGRVKPWEIMN